MNELSPRRVAWGLFLLRLMVGWGFLSEGIQKFLFPLLWLPADLRRSAFSLPEARTDFCMLRGAHPGTLSRRPADATNELHTPAFS
jgi:hypothetical protein